MVQESVEKSASGPSYIGMAEFYNAIVERLMSESLRDAKVREFELLKGTKSMSVLEYDTKFNQLVRYAPHMVVIDNMKAKGLLMASRSTCLGWFL